MTSAKISTVIALGVMLIVVSGRYGYAQAAWVIDSSQTLVQVDGAVLGDEETSENEQESNTEIEDEDESVSENESVKKQREATREAEKKRQEQMKAKFEREVETRKEEQERKEEKRKTTIENQGKRITVIEEVRDANGKELKSKSTELSEDETLYVDRPEGERLEIHVNEDELEIQGERVRTRTNFPITIGENNELIITKKDGTEKIVTILPDQAVAKLEQKGFSTEDGEPVELAESEDGQAVYKLKVKKEKRILGLFRKEFQTQTEVSAETGEVVTETSTETSVVGRILELLAF